MERNYKYAVVFQTISQGKNSVNELCLQQSLKKLSQQEAIDNLKEFLMNKKVRFESIKVLDFCEVDEIKYEELAKTEPLITINYIETVTGQKILR